MSCTPFPDRQNINTVFYVTNVILVPVLFGLGFVGNLITAILSNHSSLRKDNAVFIHICGLAIVDAVVLICTVPQTLQEVEIFPANVTYSRIMAYSSMVCYIFGNIAHHSSLWLLVTLGFFEFYMARNPYEVSRFSRNSTQRILVFVIVLLCVLFNFPRFLEVSVREIMDHCFKGMSIWDFEVTVFGSQDTFTVVYPWTITALGFALPLGLIVIAALLLWQHAGWRKLCRAQVALHTTTDADERQLGLIKTIWVMMFVGFWLNLPNLVVRLTVHLSGVQPKHNTVMYGAEIIATYLCLLQSSVKFIILIVYCSDFRKALSRTFCCLCNCYDEFYEPCACCSLTYRKHVKESRMAEEERKQIRLLREKRKQKHAQLQRKHDKHNHGYRNFDPDEKSFGHRDQRHNDMIYADGERYNQHHTANGAVYYDDRCDSVSNPAILDERESEVSGEPIPESEHPWV